MDFLRRWLSWFKPMRIRRVAGERTAVLDVFWENGRKVLHAETVNYSYGALHDVFRRALAVARVQQQRPETVLLLGFGAGSIATILHDELGLRPQLTGVDADSVVLQLAREEFDIGRIANLQLTTATAEMFVQQATSRYALIAVDVFVEGHVPPTCQAPDFVNHLQRLVEPGGVLLFNYMCYVPDAQLPLQRLLEAAFDSVEAFTVRYGEVANVVWIARKLR